LGWDEQKIDNGLGSSKLTQSISGDRSQPGGAMNTQHQSEWEELTRRKRKAGKTKRFASSMILVGVITLLVTFGLIFILAILTNFGDYHYSLGADIDFYAIMTIAAGFIGVLFLAIGYWQQANANYALGEIEKEKRSVRLQVKSEEENSWPGTPNN
jgi:hypothetical protein